MQIESNLKTYTKLIKQSVFEHLNFITYLCNFDLVINTH